MAKISTYPSVPTPASLTDMVIGTDVSDSNNTKNFEVSQMLSLYQSTTQKAYCFTDSRETAAINTTELIPFKTDFFRTSGILKGGYNSTIITISNAGYYMIQLGLTIRSDAKGGRFSVFPIINSIESESNTRVYTPTDIMYTNFSSSFAFNFAAADTLSFGWQTTTTNILLDAIGVSGSIPLTPSATIIISQI